MKKIYLWLFVLPMMITMTSCNKDKVEDINSETVQKRMEKLTELHYVNSETYTGGSKHVSSYVWDGDKLIEWDWGGKKYVYNYTDDNVTEILHYYNNGNRLDSRIVFTYNNNQITESDIYYLDNGSHYKYYVSYNDNGEISSVETNRNNEIISYQLTWHNGNLINCVTRRESSSSTTTTTTTYTYGEKKPFRYVPVASAVFQTGFNLYYIETRNNVLSSYSHTLNNDGTESNYSENYTYTYDGDNVLSRSDNNGYTDYIKYVNSSDPAPTTYKVTAQGVYGQGSVKGGGDYVSGKIVKLLATPNEGYHFTGWSNGSISNPLTFTVTSDVEYQATFEAN